MSPAEIKALGNDIRRNGLRIPTIWWRDRTTRKLYLLDGRNRLDAMEAIGRNLINDFAAPCDRWPLNLNSDHLYELPLPGRSEVYPDPYEYVLSANIHRRHLTAEQKRDLIGKLLKAKPESSNLTIAKVVKADDKTVGKVRHELVARSEIPNVEVRTDTKGRKQPAKKPPTKPPGAKPADKPRNTPSDNSNKDVAPASSGETERKLARLEELEHENVRLRRENLALRSENDELRAALARLAPAPDDDGLDIPGWLQRSAP
jgi:hypothetical protein